MKIIPCLLLFILPLYVFPQKNTEGKGIAIETLFRAAALPTGKMG